MTLRVEGCPVRQILATGVTPMPQIACLKVPSLVVHRHQRRLEQSTATNSLSALNQHVGESNDVDVQAGAVSDDRLARGVPFSLGSLGQYVDRPQVFAASPCL